MKNKAFEACLRVIEREGWKAFSFAKASQESAIPLHIFHDQFSSPADVMLHLFRRIDQDVLKNIDSFDGLSPKDTLFDILISRFEMSQPYKPVLKSFWGDWMMAPTEAPAVVCQGFSSMAWMLEAAGLESRGIKGLMRIQGLTTLYLLTLKTWLTDDSPDLGKTMVFLDKGLLKLERGARFLNF
ncbi:MAG: hypothetical protein H0X26_08085 [Alphaproteobacteria bacterium]|nr:hypothetical protein [Alphaproteobacteria bacterium]